MTEAREWTEELVAQYYEIQGYLVLRDVPTTTGQGGGRADADVLAFKIDKGTPVLRHVEVGTYYESASTIVGKLKKKFGKGQRLKVQTLVRKYLGLRTNARLEYSSQFVDAGGLSEEILTEIRQKLSTQGVEITDIWTLIEDIPHQIEAWQERETTDKGTPPMLPRSYDLLNVVLASQWVWTQITPSRTG